MDSWALEYGNMSIESSHKCCQLSKHSWTLQLLSQILARPLMCAVAGYACEIKDALTVLYPLVSVVSINHRQFHCWSSDVWFNDIVLGGLWFNAWRWILWGSVIVGSGG
jgi:hypothetical protein